MLDSNGISSPGLYHRPSLLGSTTLSTISESEPSIFDSDGGVESNAHIPDANNNDSSITTKLNNIPKNFSLAAAARWKGVNIERDDDEGGEGDEEDGGWKEVELDWDSDNDDISDGEEEDPEGTELGWELGWDGAKEREESTRGVSGCGGRGRDVVGRECGVWLTHCNK